MGPRRTTNIKRNSPRKWYREWCNQNMDHQDSSISLRLGGRKVKDQSKCNIYKISKKSAKAAKLDSVLGGGSLWFCETVCCVYAFHTAIRISLYIPKIKHFNFIGKLIWPAVALLAEQGVESWMTCAQCMCSMYCYLRNAMASSPCHRLLFHCGNLAYLGVIEEERGKP